MHHIKMALISIAFAGLVVSGYLAITYVSPVPLVCDGSGGCEIVRLSEFASFFGIPTPFYGVIFYALLGVLAALERYNLVRGLTVIGFLVSLGLTYISKFVIEAYCIWCLASGLLSTLALIVAWWPQRPKQPDVSQSLTEEIAL